MNKLIEKAIAANQKLQMNMLEEKKEKAILFFTKNFGKEFLENVEFEIKISQVVASIKDSSWELVYERDGSCEFFKVRNKKERPAIESFPVFSLFDLGGELEGLINKYGE